MDEACGSDNEGSPKYSVDLSEVDLGAISAKNKAYAWKSCDGNSMIGSASITAAERDLITAGCCFEYGQRAPLYEVSTNNVYAGFRKCRAESYSLTRNATEYAARMARPVNKIGSTAREYMQGDITSAVVRGIEAGNPSASLMAKMYVAADGQTLGGKLPESELAAMKTAIEEKA